MIFQPVDLQSAKFPAGFKINDNILIFVAAALPVCFIELSIIKSGE